MSFLYRFIRVTLQSKEYNITFFRKHVVGGRGIAWKKNCETMSRTTLEKQNLLTKFYSNDIVNIVSKIGI